MTTLNQSFVFDSAALTDPGCVRAQNEDSVVSLPEFGIWAVADGMGGHAAGDVASGIVIDELTSTGIAVSAQDQRARAVERIDRAHHRIARHMQQGEARGGGSTVAALLLHQSGLACLWAGDSRIYLLRDRRLTQLTRDHSEVAMLVAAGRMTQTEARQSSRRNVITRAIGIGEVAQPEIATGTVKDRDRFLLCSDGLTEHIEDAELAEMLASAGRAADIAGALIEETLRRGARDNVSVIVVDCALQPGFVEELD